jgi:hypothetical protein
MRLWCVGGLFVGNFIAFHYVSHGIQSQLLLADDISHVLHRLRLRARAADFTDSSSLNRRTPRGSGTWLTTRIMQQGQIRQDESNILLQCTFHLPQIIQRHSVVEVDTALLLINC